MTKAFLGKNRRIMGKTWNKRIGGVGGPLRESPTIKAGFWRRQKKEQETGRIVMLTYHCHVRMEVTEREKRCLRLSREVLLS